MHRDIYICLCKCLLSLNIISLALQLNSLNLFPIALDFKFRPRLRFAQYVQNKWQHWSPFHFLLYFHICHHKCLCVYIVCHCCSTTAITLQIMASSSLCNLLWPLSCFSRAAYLAFPASSVHPKIVSQGFICPSQISSTCVPHITTAIGTVSCPWPLLGLIMLDHDRDCCVYEEWMLSKEHWTK